MKENNLTNQAIILAGGKGLRLGRLTEKMPKPLLMVGDKIFLDYRLDVIWNHNKKCYEIDTFLYDFVF